MTPTMIFQSLPGLPAAPETPGAGPLAAGNLTPATGVEGPAPTEPEATFFDYLQSIADDTSSLMAPAVLATTPDVVTTPALPPIPAAPTLEAALPGVTPDPALPLSSALLPAGGDALPQAGSVLPLQAAVASPEPAAVTLQTALLAEPARDPATAAVATTLATRPDAPAAAAAAALAPETAEAAVLASGMANGRPNRPAPATPMAEQSSSTRTDAPPAAMVTADVARWQRDLGFTQSSPRPVELQTSFQQKALTVDASASLELDESAASAVQRNVTAERPASFTAAMAPVLNLSRPVGTPGWEQALGQRVLHAVEVGLSQAELRLDPPSLGSVHIRIAMSDDQAQLLFQASHAGARDALESAMPRLRELFADHGLQLADADVRDQSDSHAGSSTGEDQHGGQLPDSDGSIVSEDVRATRDAPMSIRGLIDTYA